MGYREQVEVRIVAVVDRKTYVVDGAEKDPATEFYRQVREFAEQLAEDMPEVDYIVYP